MDNARIKRSTSTRSGLSWALAAVWVLVAGCSQGAAERERTYTDAELLRVTDTELSSAEEFGCRTGLSPDEAAKASSAQRERHRFAKLVREARARHKHTHHADSSPRPSTRRVRVSAIPDYKPAVLPAAQWGESGVTVEDQTITYEQGVFVVTRRWTAGSRRYDPTRTSITVREGLLSGLGTGRTLSVEPNGRLHLIPDAAHPREHVLALRSATGSGYVELLRLRQTRLPVAQMLCKKLAHGMGTTCALS